MYRLTNSIQGSEEWFHDRLGKFTASIFDRVITTTGKLSASHEEIINRLVAEMIVGEPDETFQSEAMLRGKELEDDMLEFVNFTQGLNIKPCGFMQATAIDENGNVVDLGYGCSPDGLDEEARVGLEGKVPLLHTHLSYLAGNCLPKKYKQQVQGSLLVSDFKYWLFCSYHPYVKSLIIKVERDEEYIAAMKQALIDCSIKLIKRHKELEEMLNEETSIAG